MTPTPAHRVLAIDPGSERSAWLVFDTAAQRPVEFGIEANELLVGRLRARLIEADHLAIETMHARGMPTAQEEFETQFWAGRFVEAWGGTFTKMRRLDVKMNLCGKAAARDPNVRQAIIDRYGGKDRAIGGKKCDICGGKGWRGRKHDPCPVWKHEPGPLFGITDDCWSALAISVTFADKALAIPAGSGTVAALTRVESQCPATLDNPRPGAAGSLSGDSAGKPPTARACAHAHGGAR